MLLLMFHRYFKMVVGLYATVKEERFLLVANVSERIIVRVSFWTITLTNIFCQELIYFPQGLLLQ